MVALDRFYRGTSEFLRRIFKYIIPAFVELQLAESRCSVMKREHLFPWDQNSTDKFTL